MLRLLLKLICFVCMCQAQAQGIEARRASRPIAMGSLPPVEINDDIQDAFIRFHWLPGTVTMKTSGATRQLPLLFDVYNNQLYYQQAEQIMEFTDPVQQFTLSLLRQSDSVQLLFRSGYPSIHKNTESTFYEVLVDGKYQLLRCKAKSIYLNKENVPEEERTYNKELFYALLPDGKMVQVKKDKTFLLAQMPQQAASIEKLAAQHKLKMKSEDALVRLFGFLNEQ